MREARREASQLPRGGRWEPEAAGGTQGGGTDGEVEDRAQMARQSSEVVPVMDRPETTTAKKTATAHTHRTLSGPYGASFDGTDGKGHQVKGLTFERRWTTPGVHPYDEIRWETRTAAIGNESGKLVFEQKDVEVPEF
jgi:hypothetical protein